MLNVSEKAYYQALQALKLKEYGAASEHFDKAAPFFQENKEFVLLHKSVKLLLAVKKELANSADPDRIEIEEAFTNG